MGKNGSDDIATVSSLNVLVFNFTNMYAEPRRSDFFLACSFQVNIEEPAIYLTIMNPLIVTQIKFPRVQFPTVMSDTKSLNTWVLAVIISSKIECFFICDLSNLTLPIIFAAWWAS
jgi:hypothetical protein